MIPIHEKAEIVRRFLLDPASEKAFLPFFSICHSIAKGELQYLRQRGNVHLLKCADRGESIEAVACSCLGDIFARDSCGRYYVLFEGLQNLGVDDFERIDSGLLYIRIESLIIRLAYQSLAKEAGREDPPAVALRNRFKSILRSDQFCSPNESKGARRWICLRKNRDRLRREKPAMSFDRLLRIAYDGYEETKTNKEWCVRIFGFLDEADDVRNCLLKSDLLRAVVAVNRGKIGPGDVMGRGDGSPVYVALREQMEKIRTEVVNWVAESIVCKYVRKGKFTIDEAEVVRNAVESYLGDLIEHGCTDSKRTYFEEAMSADVHDIYIKRYKDAFELIVDKAAEEFQRRMRNIAAELGFVDYFG